VGISPGTSRKLAAARDIAAVLAFCAFVFLGARAVLNSPYLQKERLTSREADSDIAMFFAKADKTHPAPNAGLTGEEYAALKTSVIAQAESAGDELGRIKVRDLAYILYRAAAAFRDPGTTLHWRPPRKWKDPERRFPPFRVDYQRGKFIVTGTLDPALAGAEITGLDGVPFREFIKPALERISGETRRYREHVFCRDQAFWWDISGLLAGKPRITAGYITPGGKASSRALDTVTAGGFRRFAAVAQQPRSMTYSERKISWLNVGEMPGTRSGRKTWDRFFSGLRKKGMQHLVLDMRETSSGDIRMADHILSHLSANSGKADPEYKGKTTILIGPGTAGAGAAFAARFRELGAGEILGEETGGFTGHFSAPKEFRLPASGISFSVSSRLYPGLPDAGGGVLPDVTFTEELLRAHKDSINAFVLDRLAGERRKQD
jgi:hypothetical protein